MAPVKVRVSGLRIAKVPFCILMDPVMERGWSVENTDLWTFRPGVELLVVGGDGWIGFSRHGSLAADLPPKIQSSPATLHPCLPPIPRFFPMRLPLGQPDRPWPASVPSLSTVPTPHWGGGLGPPEIPGSHPSLSSPTPSGIKRAVLASSWK
jgi:hypothetical protein